VSYEVLGIPGLKTVAGTPNIEGVAEEVRQVYEMVARRGGEIVASHVLSHDPNPDASNLEATPREIMFFVAKYPD
jgi:hypothetical protein